MEKRWTIREVNGETVDHLAAVLGVHPLLCRLMALRGISGFEEARQFFRPSLLLLHDPRLMKDMDLAAERIQMALQSRENILLYGDYDADGTTAVGLLFNYLQSLGGQVGYYIPHREREGYGLSRRGVDQAIATGVRLVITLDCGIKAVELAEVLHQAGIDLIICDHHLPGGALPKALAILNPKQPGCPYPFKELTGCGIAFKLAMALEEMLHPGSRGIPPGLDLVATSIASDIVPVLGENRILAFHGLQMINENPSPALRALVRTCGLESGVTMEDLAFLVGPRINAAGRLDDASRAVQLFIAPDEASAAVLASGLHARNADRKELDELVTREALAIIGTPGWLDRKTTVVYQPHWHKGVVGIVASRLTETFYRPTIVLTRSGEMISGSARSVRGFNIHEAILECRDLLENYGGHNYAAGLTLRPENLESFRDRFELAVGRLMDPLLLVPRLPIDGVITFRDITPSFYRTLEQFEPSGPGNEEPLFLARAVRDTGNSRIVKNDHIRFEMDQEGSVLSGIGFGLAEKFPLLADHRPLDLVFHLGKNNWNGRTSLQMKVVDLRICAGD